MKRITFVACFDDPSLTKIENVICEDKKFLCKVPLNIKDRVVNDTLPFHVTLSVWNNKDFDVVVAKLKNFVFKQMTIDFEFATKDCNMGKMLYLKPINNIESLKALQKRAYEILPTQKYDFKTYELHSTIAIDENPQKIETLYDKYKSCKLSLTINSVCLFEIYPAVELFVKKD